MAALDFRLHGTGEAREAGLQVARPFNAALSDATMSIGLSQCDAIAVTGSLDHPAARIPFKERCTYHRASNTCFAGVELPYVEWVRADWLGRSRLIADACRRAVEATPKTRLTSDERSRLLAAITHAERNVAAHPPETLATVRLASVVYPDDGSTGSLPYLSFTGPLPSDGGRWVEIPLDQLDKTDWDALLNWRAAEERLFKLYRNEQGQLLYREAWIDDSNTVSDHRGQCGAQGTVQTHAFSNPSDARTFYNGLKADGQTAGYSIIPETAHDQIIVDLPGDMSVALTERRHALEALIDETLGWTGLGHCDGGEIGDGKASVFSLVVDYDAAATVLREALARSPFSDFSAIRRGD